MEFQSKAWTMELKAERYATFFSILPYPLSFLHKAVISSYQPFLSESIYHQHAHNLEEEYLHTGLFG